MLVKVSWELLPDATYIPNDAFRSLIKKYNIDRYQHANEEIGSVESDVIDISMEIPGQKFTVTYFDSENEICRITDIHDGVALDAKKTWARPSNERLRQLAGYKKKADQREKERQERLAANRTATIARALAKLNPIEKELLGLPVS